jgi:hypothetical protein
MVSIMNDFGSWVEYAANRMSRPFDRKLKLRVKD